MKTFIDTKRKLQIMIILFIFMTAIGIDLYYEQSIVRIQNAFGNIAFADDYAPQTYYEIEFEEWDRIFIMYPCTAENDDCLKSGLYQNSEPYQNIYLINTEGEPYSKYFYKDELVFDDIGICFARLPWAESHNGSLDGVAIEFYEFGALLCQYDVGSLVLSDVSKLEFSVSHVGWEDRSLRSFDKETNTLTVTALDGTTILFDLATGTGRIDGNVMTDGDAVEQNCIRDDHFVKRCGTGEFARIFLISFICTCVIIFCGFVILIVALVRKRKRKN